jgi:two-component system, NarL family, sensor kinase
VEAARRQLAPAGGDAARAVDWLRVALVPLLAFSQLAAVSGRRLTGFFIVLAIYGLYAVVRLVRRYHGRPLLSDAMAVATDIAAITVLTALSGGGFSMVWHAYLVLPIATAFEYRATVTAAVGLTATAAYLAQAIIHPSVSTSNALPQIAVRAAYLIWVTAACTALAGILEQRGRRVSGLLDSQQHLLVDALSADDQARAEIAESLHDHALQDLLVARQELAEAPDSEAVRRARAALEQTRNDLRASVAQLHPYVLDAVGLSDAIRRTAEDAARRGGFALTLSINNPRSQAHDRLLYSAARELLGNIVKHAGAHRVHVSLSQRHDVIELEVSDDGSGALMNEGAAIAAGHIGLATQRARVGAVGGSFEVVSESQTGTRVRIAVPA